MEKITRDLLNGSFWSMDIPEVLSWFRTHDNGLDEQQAEERLKTFGPNIVKEHLRLPKLKIILQQLSSPLILILIAAGIVTAFFGEWVETGVIFAAVAINTALGFWQENKAETVLDLLKGYTRIRARVRRSDGDHEIDASQLVPGDVIRITQGDRVPADARLTFVNNFEVDESVLTGESLPVEKSTIAMPAGTPLSDRKPMVFGGTLAMQGFADAVVTATGSDTEFGKIAAFIAKDGRMLTPLQHSVRRFAVTSGIALIFLILLLLATGVYLGKSLHDMFLITVAIAVSAVPEGLPVALTVILAIGVQRLARRKGIVRRLLAAETLGSTSIILTDKTGTLTQAKMELASVFPHEKDGESGRDKLLRNALINTDVVVENPRDNHEKWMMSGRAIETSLVRGAARLGIELPDISQSIRILDRLPFSSKRKYSVTVFDNGRGRHLSIFGAPEIIVRFTTLNREEQDNIIANIEKTALTGERVLGVASLEIGGSFEDITEKSSFSGLNFDGLISFRDPLRPQVIHAIESIASAGVRTVIVTGDHSGTAEAVARELGMLDGKGAILTGDDLNHLDPKELEARADKISVYARVTPEQKVMIVQMYQKTGNVVAVTGDGVNDAPALHTADIGVAVGSGTDVAKSAADLVVLDDNFETIASAIKEGRRVLQNIRKVIVYLFSNVLDELFLIGGALLLGLALPINALQILFVNMFSDSFPAISFAFEDGVDGFKKRPEKMHKNLLNSKMKFLILVIGGISSAVLLFLYNILLNMGFAPDLVRTFIFASFASYTLFLIFSLRSLEKSIIRYNPFSNWRLTFSAIFGLALVMLSIYMPWFQDILDTVSLPPIWLWGVFGVGMFNIFLVELGKLMFRKN